MKCPHCNIEHDRRKWCSNFCKQEAYKSEKRIANAKKHIDLSLKCKYCDNVFIPRRRSDELYCSQECNIEHHKSLLRLESAEIRSQEIRICPTCDKEFSPKRTLKEIYCSSYCRNLIPRKMYKALRTCLLYTNQDKIDQTYAMLGYSPKQLQEHVHQHPNWENVKNKNWHLDHVFPIIAFTKRGITDPAIINHLSNLQPLSEEENCVKNDNYDEESFEQWIKTL